MAGDRIDASGSAVLLVGARSGPASADGSSRLLKAMVQVARGPSVTRFVVNIADVDPGDAVWVRPGEAPTQASPYHAVVELTAGQRDLRAIVMAASAALAPAPVHAYRVTRLPERLDTATNGSGRPTAGTKYLVLCRFHPDLPDSAARRSWDHHVALALRVHQGAARYVRSWIDAPLTPGAPRFQGMTELYFATRDDMRDRWFGSDSQRAEIVQDIGHFLLSGVRLYTSEHVLKEVAI